MTDYISDLSNRGVVMPAESSLYVSRTPMDMLYLPQYSPLIIKPEDFIANYNLDIEDFVEQHKAKEDAQSKGGANQLKRPILYMSYSHAIRLLRSRHPELEVDCVRNFATGGYIFQEIDRLGYFILSYVHDGKSRSALYYNAMLTMSGQGIHPDDVKSDYKTGKPKLTPTGNTISVVDSAAANKAYYRALVKAIAMVTGIGLKLWTGDDLADEIVDAKMILINNVKKLNDLYYQLQGEDYEGVAQLDYTSSEAEIKRVGKSLQLAYKALEQAKNLSSDVPLADK